MHIGDIERYGENRKIHRQISNTPHLNSRVSGSELVNVRRSLTDREAISWFFTNCSVLSTSFFCMLCLKYSALTF